MSTLSAIGDAIMWPLYWAVSAVLVGFHYVFSLFGFLSSGVVWTLSIIGLTVVVRAAIVPIFVKQIKAQRNMQLLQPHMRELQKKYGHDRERLSQETMKLFKESGTNPMASCLPLLLQMPIFFALFRTINDAAKGIPKGVLTQSQANSLEGAQIFGAHLADSFLGSGSVSVRIFAGVLVLGMTAISFMTQRQLMTRNMPADSLKGPYAQQQKTMLYVLPLVFAGSGLYFPIGVLLYWITSYAWALGQQLYVIRNNPVPGTPAFAAKEAREARKHPESSSGTPAEEAPAVEPQQPQRQQPKRQSRSQRKGQNRPKGSR
jgi:YidC/Oxa1 family membrane protein insertase